MNYTDAKNLFGKNYIGPEELSAFSGPFSFKIGQVPTIPFNDETLNACAQTHVLVFAPAAFADGAALTIVVLRERMGVDPSMTEPCMYNQDWYVKEDFAAIVTPDNAWHLLRKEVLEDARAKRPEDIEHALPNKEAFPTAVVCALTFFAFWLTYGTKLWLNDFVWCRDRDHNDDRIYIGRYEDPTGVNKNGFNIHRHLALRPAYSAAPEIIK